MRTTIIFELAVLSTTRQIFYKMCDIIIVMKKASLLALIFLQLPSVAFAQSLDLFFIGITEFFQFVLLPFLIAVAFGFFLLGLVRFAIAGSANEDGRQRAKALIIWSIVAFVLITAIFGIVNLLADSIFGPGSEFEPATEPDFFEMW